MTIDYNNIENNYSKSLDSLLLYLKEIQNLKKRTDHTWNAFQPESTKIGLILDYIYRMETIRNIVKLKETDFTHIIPSLHTLNRSLLENFLIFHYIFIQSLKSEKLLNLRLLLYWRDGLLIRQNFHANQPEALKMRMQEAQIIPIYEKQINELFAELKFNENEKKKLLKKWKKPYLELIEDAKFGKLFKTNSYSYLSSHSHNLYSGLIQTIENERKNNSAYLMKNCMTYTFMITSHYIENLINKPIKIDLAISTDIKKTQEFYYNLGKQ